MKLNQKIEKLENNLTELNTELMHILKGKLKNNSNQKQIQLMSSNTLYSIKEIEEFITVTGLSNRSASIFLNFISNNGIDNLGDVIVLAKMNLIDFKKILSPNINMKQL